MGQLFGTDGVRGIAGRDLDAGLAMRVAAAAASVLGVARSDEIGAGARRRPKAVVGRDPRVSGEFLESAVVAGLAGNGVDVIRLGVIPTPAVAYLTDVLAADFGVMLSASHNPAPDNGIKFFAGGGLKLPDEVEDEIEARMAGQAGAGEARGIPEAGFGRVRDGAHEAERYLAHLLETVGIGNPHQDAQADLRHRQADPRSQVLPLAGWRIVVDCAHGAAYHLGPRMLRQAGADVIAIGVEPDGLNINAGCGSTSLDTLRSAVLEHSADAGIAYDGDADRCLAVDSAGEVIDGDQILAVLALALKEAGRLAGTTVVATVMANLGFRKAMAESGIDVVETPVGDRYLIAAMLDGKYVLGGEQSGHVIMLDHASTGDGMLTSIQLLATAAASGRSLAELGQVMTRYPQVLVNVHGVDKAKAAASGTLSSAIAAAQAELGESGRVLVRPSGTEPAVRVMVEAVDSGQARQIADRLAEAVRASGADPAG
ncbi:MAG TPA: phosphoglucosamine mutase [Streptosporangiaceae bacterium]|nr:phosphoglucosamine mutase [Streptosporangiaceae bacterium]